MTIGRNVRRGKGFTLIEILVVIGIIAVLLSLLLPAIAGFRRAATKKAVQADLQAIGQALDAYKSDFGDYPRPPSTNLSYHVLAWGLIGASEALDPYGNTTVDGNPGPGFRTAAGAKVWGPYVPPEKFQPASALAQSPYARWDLFDRFGSPIEYFPRWHPANDQFLGNKTAANPSPTTGGLFGTATANVGPVTTVYDYHQMWRDDPKNSPPVGTGEDQSPLNYLRKALGDLDLSDKIAPTADGQVETLKEAPAYILMSRGPQPKYSNVDAVTNRFNKCLEITNLNIE